MNEKHLCRSSTDKRLAGVCGGIAQYFGIDSTIVRLIWFLVSWAYGLGLLAYLACALIMPKDSDFPPASV